MLSGTATQSGTICQPLEQFRHPTSSQTDPQFFVIQDDSGTATGHGGSEPDSTRQDVAPDRVDGRSKGSDTGARHTANAARDFDFENMHSKADTLSTGYGLCLDINSGTLYSAQGDTERAEFYTMIGEITRFQASVLDHIPLSATQHTGFRPLCRQMLPMLCLI